MSAENQNQEAAIDPQVEAPGEEPVNGDLMGRLLHQALHDGEVYNEKYKEGIEIGIYICEQLVITRLQMQGMHKLVC